MMIERTVVPTATLRRFADEHGLVMVVSERKMDRWQRERRLKRYTAAFKRAEVSGGGCLIGVYGEGDTEGQAIADYARKISSERLVVDACEPSRRVIDVPRLESD